MSNRIIHLFLLALILCMSEAPHAATAPTKSYEGTSVRVKTRKGEEIRGGLLYAADSVIVLWQSPTPYERTSTEQFARAIRYSSIDTLTIVPKNHGWTWFGYGALLAGGAGVALTLPNIGSRGGDGAPSGLGIMVLVSVPGAVGGGALAAIMGAISSLDESREIGGDYWEYHDFVPALNTHSMFKDTLPTELAPLISLGAEAGLWEMMADTILYRPTHSLGGPRHISRNVVYGEIAGGNGDGYGYSLNYEFLFTTTFRLRFGYCYAEGKYPIQNMESYTIANGTFPALRGVVVMPTLLLGRTVTLEIGAGASYAYGTGLRRDHVPTWWLFPAATFGLRYQPLDNGLMFRAGLSIVNILTYPFQFGVGYAF